MLKKSKTKKIKVACCDLYVTIDHDKNKMDGIRVKPNKGGCAANISALSELASELMILDKTDKVIEILDGIHCPACSRIRAKDDKDFPRSCADAIARVLTESIQEDKNNEKISNEQIVDKAEPEKV